jgi:hypothetical protein
MLYIACKGKETTCFKQNREEKNSLEDLGFDGYVQPLWTELFVSSICIVLPTELVS